MQGTVGILGAGPQSNRKINERFVGFLLTNLIFTCVIEDMDTMRKRRKRGPNDKPHSGLSESQMARQLARQKVRMAAIQDKKREERRLAKLEFDREMEELKTWMREFDASQPPTPPKQKIIRSYGHKWKNIRKEAMNRAGGVCEKCHKKPATDVHHRLPVRFFAKVEDAHFQNNLQALCLKCHQKEENKLWAAMPLLYLIPGPWKVRK